MALPSLPRCPRLNQENELLHKKLRHVRLKNKQLESDLAQMQEQLHTQNKLMPVCVAKRSVQVQTEIHLRNRGDGVHGRQHEVAKENARLHQMYNNLHRRHNKEIKTNQEQNETISVLSYVMGIGVLNSDTSWVYHDIHGHIEERVKINELEQQLLLARQRIKEMESKKVTRKGKTFPDQLLLEIQHLKKENEKLSRERRMLRNELAALDKDFFDEIEDLKYALQESLKLNDQYEKCLKQLSSTCGFTFASVLPSGGLYRGLRK